MATDIRIVEEARKPLAMHPKKFALWLFIASVIMLFGAWTSAYIVKRGDIGWYPIVLPSQFYVNTAIIAASSLTMIWAVRSARKDNVQHTKYALVSTVVLGIIFLVGQWLGWKEMVAMKYYFTGMGNNTASSFIYVLSGFHGAHIIGGLVALLITLNIGNVLGRSFLPKFLILGRIIEWIFFVIFIFAALDTKHKIRANSKNMVTLEMCSTYWHFMGLLWLYLFVFLLLNP